VINSIDARFKNNYEQAFKHVLPWRMPVIVRLDGKCFHNFTSKMAKPFSYAFTYDMNLVAKYLIEEVDTARLAYVQSDEISLLLIPYNKLASQPWFGNEIQKICSVTAGIASSYMTLRNNRIAVFDSRCFVIPETEVVNYFISRQQDCTRNSINAFGQSVFSHSELQHKSQSEILDMLYDKGYEWESLVTRFKRGSAAYRDNTDITIDTEIPIFSKDREYISRFLATEE